jgi:hypothetical protein
MMTHHWDEFSKSLAQPLPRRESLRRLGIALAGTVLSPLGLQTAFAGHHSKRQTDLCKSFCKCRNKKQQDQCLKTCAACGKDPSRLHGSCGNYFCCGAGQTDCGGYCADLSGDPFNCGGCGRACEPSGPYEYGACLDGDCRYACAEGAEYCGETCTFLKSDPDNCGACNFVCDPPGPNEYRACIDGRCTYGCVDGGVYCDGVCTYLGRDPDNCGACGNVCPGSAPYCNGGVCGVCPAGTTLCSGRCVYLPEDPGNCGACGVVCPAGTSCRGGFCQDNDPPPSDP